MTKMSVLFQMRVTPTVESNPVLSISHAAINLRRALKKKDADQVEIIIILTCCSNTQRHEIVKTYYAEFGRVSNLMYFPLVTSVTELLTSNLQISLQKSPKSP